MTAEDLPCSERDLLHLVTQERGWSGYAQARTPRACLTPDRPAFPTPTLRETLLDIQ
jgi:hypothetical protein